MSGVVASGPELAGFEAILALTGGVIAVVAVLLIVFWVGIHWLNRLWG